MAWGGGTITGGAPMGGSVGGSPGNPGNGLPFAGIPWEMRQGVEQLLADEPDLAGDARWEASESRSPTACRRPASACGACCGRPADDSLSTFFIVVEALCVQAGPFLSQKGIDDGITPHDWTASPSSARSPSSLSWCRRSGAVLRVATTGRVASRVMFELRVRTFAHLQRLSLDYYTDEKAGVIMTRMTSDIESLQQLLQDGLPQFALQGLTMVVVTVVLFFYNVELALITLLIDRARCSRGCRCGSARRPTRATAACATPSPACSATSRRAFPACGWSPATTGPRHNVLQHRNVVGEYRDANDYTARLAATYGACTEFVGLLGQAALLLIGGNMVRDGTLTVGELTAFILYLNSFFRPIQQLVQLYNLYQQGQAAITKLGELLGDAPDASRRRPTRAAARRSRASHPRRRLLRLRPGQARAPRRRPAHRRGRDLSPGRARPARASRRSPSSSPASTTRRAARSRIDGHDLRDVTLDSLRRQLGVVPQEPFLFAGTDARQHRLRPARRHRRRGHGGGATRRPRRARRAAPRGRRHAGARAGRVAVVGGAPAASRWPGRSWPRPGCSCSTRPRRTST